MMGIHWILYGFIILSIFSVILTLVEKGLVDTATEDVFRYSVIALAFFIRAAWIIKKRWIYFPWQHDKDGGGMLDRLVSLIHWVSFCERRLVALSHI